MRYRKEIDGLRAVAVLPVILFHGGLSIFSGGFVGVDIFFVISGFLITGIILSELEADTFSIINFYERRIRRIAPALYLVMAATIIVSWFVLMPREMKDYAQSLVAVTLSSSNFLFWSEDGYFETAAELKPLLHTWSLAIEEQYYIIFPICMALMWRFGKNKIFLILSTFLIASLTLAHWAVSKHPSAAFYLLPFRAWELLIGVLLAFYLHDKDYREFGKPVSQALSLLGLLLILYAIFAFDELTPFPSLYALIPTLGAGLIILFANSGTLVNLILSNRIFVGIGLVSYSAYLWHQPLFAFTRYRSINEPSLALTMLICVATFLLAYLSWRYVERPFRDKTVFDRKTIFTLNGIIAGAIIALGLYVNDKDGLPSRFDGNILQALSVTDGWEDISECNLPSSPSDQALQTCLKNKPFVYLFGDSHASAFSKQLRLSLKQQGISLISWSHAGCLPIRGTTVEPISANQSCIDYKNRIFEEVKKNPAPMIISARWRIHLEGVRYDNGEGGVELGSNMQNVLIDPSDKTLAQHITEELNTVSALAPLIVLNQIPEPGWNVPSRVARYLAANQNPNDITTSYKIYKQRNARLNAIFESLNNTVSVLKTDELVCDQNSQRCKNVIDGQPLYRDEDHTAEAYNTLLASEITKAVLDKIN